jgi:hypothetical protein
MTFLITIMQIFVIIFFLLSAGTTALAADFDCSDVRLSAPQVSFEQTTDIFADAYASENENCLIDASNKMVEKMFELNDGGPEHFQQYVAAMRYLGQTPHLTNEARMEIARHLETLYIDEGFLSYYIEQQEKIEDESAFYSTATLLGVTGVTMSGEWLLQNVFALALRNSPTRITRSAGFRGLRRVGAGLMRSPRIPRVQPRLLARGIGGTANGNIKESGKTRPILDLKYSPMRLAGLTGIRTSLTYSTFWETFTQQAGKWTGAAAMGFGSGIGFGHLAHNAYEKMGLTKLAAQTAEKVEALRKLTATIRASRMASRGVTMLVHAFEPVAFAASTVATLVTLRGLEMIIRKLKAEEVRAALAELKTQILAAHAPGSQHNDYKVFVGVNLLIDHVRMLEAIKVSEEIEKQLDISNQYITSAAIEPICNEIKGQPTDLETKRAGALARLSSTLTYANIMAKPNYDAVQNIYDENLQFIGSLKGTDGNLESYLEPAMVRLSNMKLLSGATLDTPSRIELLQQTAEGLYLEMKDRLVSNPEYVEKEFSCYKPSEYLADPQLTIAY